MGTCFEDLSNELLCEIFDYLDSCARYEAFAHLNARFYRLIHYSTLPLAVNLSLLSKATFQHRCNHVVRPNVHRIISLRLSHHLLIERFFNAISVDSSFRRLETFILIDAESDNLISILTSLASLPRLSSLTITCVDEVRSRDVIYFLIIRLSALKYCRLSIDSWNQDVNVSLVTTEYSPLEHLVIDMKCALEEVLEVLNYTPQLKRLSCRMIISNSTLFEIPVIPVELTSLRLQLEETSFDEFEWFITQFGQQLEVLTISAKLDVEFMDASRWEELISNHLPRLRQFDLRFEMVFDAILDYNTYNILKEGFHSTFWYEKQWFSAHQSYTAKNGGIGISFYSIEPFRWHQYDLHDNVTQSKETTVNVAWDIRFHNYQVFPEHSIPFLRATRLTFSTGDFNQLPSFIPQLPWLFLPTRITELVIADEHFRFDHLLLFCDHFPNLQSLTIPKSALFLSSPQPQTNPVTTEKHGITNVVITDQCSIHDIQILLHFCPYLKKLEIEVDCDHLPFILCFLLRKQTNHTHRDHCSPSPPYKSLPFWKQEYANCMHCARTQQLNSSDFALPCNHRLSALCVRNTKYKMIKKVQALIDQEALLIDYSIEYLDQKMYLWW